MKKFPYPLPWELPVLKEETITKPYIDFLVQRIQEGMTRLASASLTRCHQLHFVQPPRSGALLPVGSCYVDGSGTLRMVLSGQAWAIRKQGTGKNGKATAS